MMLHGIPLSFDGRLLAEPCCLETHSGQLIIENGMAVLFLSAFPFFLLAFVSHVEGALLRV